MKKSFTYAPDPFKKMPAGFKKLSVANAVYLTDRDKNGIKIPEKEFYHRVKEVEDFFVELFGGHTRAASGKGEFLSKDKKIIAERTVKIEGFAEVNTFKKNRLRLKDWLLKKKKEWKQEYIGYEFEGDLFYI